MSGLLDELRKRQAQQRAATSSSAGSGPGRAAPPVPQRPGSSRGRASADAPETERPSKVPDAAGAGLAKAPPVAAAPPPVKLAANELPAPAGRTLVKRASSGKIAAAKFRKQRADRLQAEADSSSSGAEGSSPDPLAAAARKPAVKRRDLEPKRDPFEEWDTYYAEGEPYYVNRKTGETTWDKPQALLSSAESEALTGDFVWVPHDVMAWIPAKIVDKRPNGDLTVAERPLGVGEFKVELEDRRYVRAKELGPPVTNTQALTSLTSDLVQLDEVHEPGIIDLLRRRYTVDKIYTNVGDILVAINPFKPTDLFTPTLMHQYAQTGREAMELAPHPYAVINGAYRAMIDDAKDQSLLISGESGAGKTVTVKVCLEFLSEIAGSDNAIEQKILDANPILEAFGNAKTVRNDNSSRFGKFMEIHFAGDGTRKIVGCHTINYLLEKSRVVDQAAGERNFHIFHYLVDQFDKSLRQTYKVDLPPTSFKYLPNERMEASQHNDADECSMMHQALESMGFTSDERDGMFRTVAAILHLGNLEFEDFESTGSKITSTSAAHVRAACELLGVDPDKLSDVLTMHVSQQRDGLLKRAFNTKMASDARNAMARHLYSHLFQWIVGRINLALTVEGAASDLNQSAAQRDTTFIGMLDIFGFEIFETNSFEQLCINFANEKLQQMFNRHTFTLEEQTYRNEGVPFEQIEFHDSQPLLSFLGMGAAGDAPIREGVFQLLDEQTTINGTDDKFLQAMISRNSDKRSVFSDRCKSRTAFQVNHYAGTVEYETAGFVYKNADKLYENIEGMLEESSVQLVQALFADDDTAPEIGRRKMKTQASTFMRQLSQLEDRTNATFPRYIRCVKPNSQKRPNLFNAPSCLEQLRFAGVFEAVQIRKKGYPFRKLHANFFASYRCVEPNAVSRRDWDDAKRHNSFASVAAQLIKALSERSVPAARDCHFGKTMVLYRADQHRALEIQRLGVLNRAAAEIQKLMRGMYVRAKAPALRSLRTQLDKAIKARNIADIDRALSVSNEMFFKIKEAYDAEAVKEAIKLEHQLEPKIVSLLSQTERPETCFDNALFQQIDQICSQMQKYRKRDDQAFVACVPAAALLKRYNAFKEQRELRAGLESALGQLAHRTAQESISDLSALLAPDRSIEADSLRQIVTTASSTLRALEAEVQIFEACTIACESCAVLPPAETDNMIVTKTESNIARLRQAAGDSAAHTPLSVDGVDAKKRVDWAHRLYEAVLVAMRTAKHADDPEWEAVDHLVDEGKGLTVTDNVLFSIQDDQLSLIVAELTLRAQVDAVVRKLDNAVKNVNDEPMATALEQAHALRLLQHADPEVRRIVGEGDVLLPKIRTTRAKLLQAIQAVDESLLYDALSHQQDCGWGDTAGMVGHDTVHTGRTLYGWVQNLTREARQAVKALEIEPTQAVVDGCDEIGLRIPELEPLREFLALPKNRQILRQRDAAVALGNYARAVALSTSHKDLEFDSQDSDNYSLEHFPKLKTPEEFAKRFGLTFSKYKHNFLHHYNPMFGKIHTSLTTLENQVGPNGKTLHKTATLQFKNVFGIMGDKVYENIDSLAVDLLTTGLTTPELVDEIYCQVMKQLTENPKPDSEARGWNLLSMILATFPPSKDLENYLEHFLRKNGRRTCVKTLHCTLLCGPLRSVPSIQEIAQQRQPTNADCWFEGARTEITLPKSAFQGPLQPDQVVVDWRGASSSESEPPVPSARSNVAAPPGHRTLPSVPPSVQPGHGSVPGPPPRRAGGGSAAPAPRTGAGGGPPPPPPKVNRPAAAAHARAPTLPPTRGGGGAPPPPPPPPARLNSPQLSVEDEDLI